MHATAAEWLIAGGTISAVVVAVSLQASISFRERRRKPTLTLAFDDHAYAWESAPNGTRFRYLRLAITNARGKHAAEDVEVFVLRVDGGPPGGRISRWLVNPSLRWPNLRREQPPLVTIPPGATR